MLFLHIHFCKKYKIDFLYIDHRNMNKQWFHLYFICISSILTTWRGISRHSINKIIHGNNNIFITSELIKISQLKKKNSLTPNETIYNLCKWIEILPELVLTFGFSLSFFPNCFIYLHRNCHYPDWAQMFHCSFQINSHCR